MKYTNNYFDGHKSFIYYFSPMIATIKSALSDLIHLFFPHHCEGCSTDVLANDALLCARCMELLPATGFLGIPGNPVERSLYGRLPVAEAGAAYYFTKDSLLQHLLAQLKYRNNRDAGYFLGRMMGYALVQSGRFQDVDALVPLPLNPKREYKRGYNQAKLICEGISNIWQKPIVADAISRTRFTETQTHQNRLSRWQNMEDAFVITDQSWLMNKHILLIDDVITTGATIEACGMELLKVAGLRLSVGAVAYTI